MSVLVEKTVICVIVYDKSILSELVQMRVLFAVRIERCDCGKKFIKYFVITLDKKAK